MKLLLAFAFLITYHVSLISVVHADYVLPYPSFMPGNKIYRITRIVDLLKRYWYWGNIGSIKYHMQLADKYLVEAKTLMEYKQYFLASDALERSNNAFIMVPQAIIGAREKGIDVTSFQNTISEEAVKHIEVLTNLLAVVPKEFTWTPEKADATHLELEKIIRESITLRNNL